VRFLAVRLVALLVAAVGVVNVLTALRPHHRLAHVAAHFDGGRPARAQALFVGVLLIAVARGLIGARVTAWIGGVTLLGIATLTTMPHQRALMLLTGTALVILITHRRLFDARPGPARLRTAAHLGLAAVALATVAMSIDAYANRGQPGVGRAVFADAAAPDGWRAGLITLAVALALLAAAAVALAPAPAPNPGPADERAEVWALTDHEAADSLAPFATRADKTYVFSPDRAAAIGYRVVLGTALAGGDPVGDPRSAPEAMRAFLDLCAVHGWRPGVLGASDEMAPLWRDLGLRGMHIGDEAVLPVGTFSLESRKMRNVRQAVNRSRNAGVRVTIGPLSRAHAERLRPILDHWLHGQRERGFAMNLDRVLIPRADCVVTTAWSAEGEPVAFARFAVCADGSVLTLDVAPRGPDAPNGVAERMIVETVDYARATGAREVSLNFAAMRWVFEAPGLGARMFARIIGVLDRWIEIGSLNRFCGKFSPEWRARNLMMRSWLEFGWVVAAALRAELGTVPARAPEAAEALPPPCLDYDTTAAAGPGSAARAAGHVDRLA
jgi:lysyl-tRNA synthetase class 2